jgi:hypothetical protein
MMEEAVRILARMIGTLADLWSIVAGRVSDMKERMILDC